MYLPSQRMSSKANHSRFIYCTFHTNAVIYYSCPRRRFLAQFERQLSLCGNKPTFTMPVFSELLLIMLLKDVKRFLKDSMKSASPLFSQSLGGDEVESQSGRRSGGHCLFHPCANRSTCAGNDKEFDVPLLNH